MKRRPKIREVDVEVLSGVSDTGDASGAAAQRDPDVEPLPEPVWADSLESPPTSDDVGEPADERRFQERPAWPAAVPVLETNVVTQTFAEHACEITFWRGYVKAAFYARLVADSDPLAAVARSPYFRHRGTALPEPADEALSAYETLRQQLEHAGWEHVRPGAVWFADVFSRSA